MSSSSSFYYFSSFSFKLICSTSQGKFRESKALEAVYCLSWKFPSFKDILPRPSFSSGSLATLKRGADDNFKVLCYIILLRNPYLDDGRNSICLWLLFLLPVVKDCKYGCGFGIEPISRPNWPVKVLDTKWTVWYAFKQDQRQNPSLRLQAILPRNSSGIYFVGRILHINNIRINS